MSNDYLAERTEKLAALTKHMSGHHKNYADRVESIVCEMFKVSPTALRIRSRMRVISHARYVLFYILYQRKKGYDRRSMGWLGRRYNIDPWSVRYALRRIEELPELQQKATTAMALLAAKLEFELFGPRRGSENDAIEKPRGCDTLF